MGSPLEYPLDVPVLMRRRQALKVQFSSLPGGVELRIALLGGSTTAELREFLHVFLLAAGVRPTFFECEYNQYESAILHDDAELSAFQPQVVIIHTTATNARFPDLLASDEAVEGQLQAELARFEAMWSKLITEVGCVVLQNNFELPLESSLGGLDASQPSGRRNFLRRLNDAFARAAHREPRLVLNDIEHLSAMVGLERWHDRRYWLSYKLAASHAGLAAMAHNLTALIRAIVGKARKCLVLDLDNTLWGGVIGDDGLTGIRLSKETPEGEAYTAFQRYCRELKTRGVLLAVCSKNDPEIAKQGLSHPDSILQLTDFAAFKAGWGPKYDALVEISRELNLGLDSFVFVDDNPVERAAVAAQLPMVAVPDMGDDPSKFVDLLDRQLYFETVSLSAEDTQRAGYYESNLHRNLAQATFASYGDFLDSLQMQAVIAPFSPLYMERIAQLTGKTNQFNLTSRRYTLAELDAFRTDPGCLTLYGRLADKFGDNGLVTVIAGHQDGTDLVIDLWLMSCRVLKRDLELAMLDELAALAQARGLSALRGRYLPTAKNALVADHYERLGFERMDPSSSESEWRLPLAPRYQPKNKHIKEIVRG